MSAGLPRLEAIALIGSKNQKIYLNARTCYQEQADSKTRNDLLRLEYAAHCALDVVEERAHVRGTDGDMAPAAVCFLGLVLTLEDLAVYAMVTSTRLRILLMLSPGENRVRDLDCVTILRAVHTCYLSYIGNPFHAIPQHGSDRVELQPGQANAHIEIKSKAFDGKIRAIGGW